MGNIALSKEGSVFIITMIDSANKNTLRGPVLKEYNEIFDQIEETRGNAALLLRSSDPKISEGHTGFRLNSIDCLQLKPLKYFHILTFFLIVSFY